MGTYFELVLRLPRAKMLNRMILINTHTRGDHIQIFQSPTFHELTCMQILRNLLLWGCLTLNSVRTTLWGLLGRHQTWGGGGSKDMDRTHLCAKFQVRSIILTPLSIALKFIMFKRGKKKLKFNNLRMHRGLY